MSYIVQSLEELTTSQLEAALEVGEGSTDIEILEIKRQVTVKKTWVMSTDGQVVSLPTHVAYDVIIKDDQAEDGEIAARIHVEVTRLGIVAHY